MSWHVIFGRNFPDIINNLHMFFVSIPLDCYLFPDTKFRDVARRVGFELTRAYTEISIMKMNVFQSGFSPHWVQDRKLLTSGEIFKDNHFFFFFKTSFLNGWDPLFGPQEGKICCVTGSSCIWKFLVKYSWPQAIFMLPEMNAEINFGLYFPLFFIFKQSGCRYSACASTC